MFDSRFGRFVGAVLLAVAFGALAVAAQGPADTLLSGFQNPPASAKPRVWWHWMNGNITKDGIKADLEWMKRVGIGGVQNFDAALMTPVVVDKRLVFMTPEWKEAFASAVALADKLGLEFAIAGSPGWSESGGPWVPAEQGMKKLVWTETRVDGGKPFGGSLAKPPSSPGPFQNARSVGGLGGFGEAFKAPDFYRDVAVLAVPTPSGDLSMAELAPTFSVGGARVDAAKIADGDFTTTVSFPAAAAGQSANLDIDLGKPQTICALSLGTTNTNPMAMFQAVTDDGPQLFASEDGLQYRPVARVPRGRLPQYTVSFPGVRTRYVRVAFETPAPERIAEGIDIPGLDLRMPAAKEVLITELALHTAPRVHRSEDKAGFAPTPGLGGLDTPQAAADQAIATDAVIDLTAKMRPDGTLDWAPPAGRWTVLRLGYSLTGKENSPASPEATGLEVDKMSASAVKAYFTRYLDMYRDASGGLMGRRGLGFMITDSWEAGVANWTDEMIAEFTKRRGYDPRPWLPALTGRIVRSAEATDRFLFDFRATIAELTVVNHYDQLTTMLRERGMARYSESHEDRRAMIADGMEVKRTAAIPMSAMWTGRGGPLGVPPQFAADIRESASVAHIYGQNIVAAESLTAGGGAYTFSPETLKATADAELSSGLNRFVIHTSVHQPLEKKPGLGLGPFGQWFTRHETWAEQAGVWMTYLARSSYMLQQGKFVADVLYHYGDDSNITALFGEKGPDIPAGYSFDYANTDVVLNRLAVSNGRLTTTTGMQYRVLVLDANARLMTLPVLRKLRDMVKAGAVVAGARPVRSPRLMDDEKEFTAVADELWGSGAAPRTVGAGRVYADGSVAAVAAAEKIAPDFEHSKPRPDTALLFVHRALPDGDIYWVNNRQKRDEAVETTFRATGRAPEVWHADTGVVEPASYRVVNGRTVVPLRLTPEDAVFVVFRKAATVSSRVMPVPSSVELAALAGPWTVAFQAGRGAPASATFATLTSWSENAAGGIKYFSGTAIYRMSVDVPAAWVAQGAQLWIDLGDVKNLAQVTVNGKVLATVWKRPFEVNVTGALHAGSNTVEVAVTNLWVNRIVGDQQPDAKDKLTFTPMPFYRANSPLLPSGLLGPVRIVTRRAGM
jgi:hypothetical protein